MQKVTSTETVHFPKLSWGINAGETRELPADKDAQERILAEPGITPVTGEQVKQEGAKINSNKNSN